MKIFLYVIAYFTATLQWYVNVVKGTVTFSNSEDLYDNNENDRMMFQVQTVLTERGNHLYHTMLSINERSILQECEHVACTTSNKNHNSNNKYQRQRRTLSNFTELFQRLPQLSTSTTTTANTNTNTNSNSDLVQLIQDTIPDDITVGDFFLLLHNNPILFTPTRRHRDLEQRQLQNTGAIVLAILIIVPIIIIEVYSQIRGIPISCLFGLKRRLFFGLNCSLWFEDPCTWDFDKLKNKTSTSNDTNKVDILGTDPMQLIDSVLLDNVLFSTMNDMSFKHTLIDIANVQDDEDDEGKEIVTETGRQQLLRSSLIGGIIPILSLQETAEESHTTIECIITNCRRTRYLTRKVDNDKNNPNLNRNDDGAKLCAQELLHCTRNNILSLLSFEAAI